MNLHRYNKENSEIKEIVARFDEVIADKVNKFSLLQIKKEFSETYLKSDQLSSYTNKIEDMI